MAKLGDVQSSLVALKAKVETEHAEVKAAITFAVTGLTDQIKALKDQIAAGTAATEADLDQLVAAIAEVSNAVGTISDEVVVPTE